MEIESKTSVLPLSGWRYWTFLATVAVAAVGYLLFSLWGGWQEVVQSIGKAGLTCFGACLMLSLINYLCRFFRWQRYLGSMGIRIPKRRSLRIYLSGYALAMTPGKAGEALRCLLLKEYDVSYDKSLAALFAERFADLVAAGCLAMVGLSTYSRARPFLLAVAVCIIATLIVVSRTSTLKAMERFSFRLGKKLGSFVRGLIDSIFHFRSCLTPVNFAVGVGWGMMGWVAEAIGLYFILFSLGSTITFSTAMFIYIFSVMVGALTFLPGGLGGTEVSMFELLIIKGVASPVAVAATLLIRVATLWFSVLLGLLSLSRRTTVARR